MDVREVAAYLQHQGSSVRFVSGFPSRFEVEHPISVTGATAYDDVKMGAYSFIGAHTEVRHVTFGRFCSIARRITIGLGEHPTELLTTHPIAFGAGGAFRKDPYYNAVCVDGTFRQPGVTEIGHDVWIGDGAFLRRGVKIGNGAIIAARSVVTRDVPPYAIVKGIPATVSRYRFDEKTRARIEASQWWNVDFQKIGANYAEIEKALDLIEARGRDVPKLSFKSSVVVRDGEAYRVER